MSAIDTYYGKSKGWKTFLEIYSLPAGGGKRQIHRQLSDQDAYDTWHLSFYMKEILSYKKLLVTGKIKFDDIPRKEKNLLVYMLLKTIGKHRSILELGHSLFELIDGMEVVNAYFNGIVALRNFKYLGVDISPELCLTSKLLHPEYQIKTFLSVGDALKRFDVLYDRNVSSYAFTTPDDLAGFMNRADIALMNLFLSKGKTFLSHRLGKSLTYFSQSELARSLKKPLYHLFGEKSPGPFRGSDLGVGQARRGRIFSYGQ